jgi:hypothetical protein
VNVNCASKCSGSGCVFSNRIGFIILDVNNIAVYFELDAEIASKLNSGAILSCLYDNNDSLVYVSGVRPHLEANPLFSPSSKRAI